MNYEWSNFIETKAPLDRNCFTSSSKAIVTNCRNWELFVFTENNYKLYKQEILSDIIICECLLCNIKNARIIYIKITKNKGIEISSTRWLLDKDSIPKYVYNKVENLPNELTFEN